MHVLRADLEADGTGAQQVRGTQQANAGWQACGAVLSNHLHSFDPFNIAFSFIFIYIYSPYRL